MSFNTFTHSSFNSCKSFSVMYLNNEFFEWNSLLNAFMAASSFSLLSALVNAEPYNALSKVSIGFARPFLYRISARNNNWLK